MLWQPDLCGVFLITGQGFSTSAARAMDLGQRPFSARSMGATGAGLCSQGLRGGRLQDQHFPPAPAAQS